MSNSRRSVLRTRKVAALVTTAAAASRARKCPSITSQISQSPLKFAKSQDLEKLPPTGGTVYVVKWKARKISPDITVQISLSPNEFRRCRDVLHAERSRGAVERDGKMRRTREVTEVAHKTVAVVRTPSIVPENFPAMLCRLV